MLTVNERTTLVARFVRHSLAMEGLAHAVGTEIGNTALSGRLVWQIKQLRFRARDVQEHKLEPSDLATLVRNLQDTLVTLNKRNLPASLTKQLGVECSCLESVLLACGIPQ